MTPTPAATDDPGATLQRAVQLHGEGAVAEAAEHYLAVLAVDPACTPARHLLGIALHQLGRGDEAVALIRENLAAGAPRSDWLNDLGNVLTEQGRLDEAASAFAAALDLAPEDVSVWINLGSVHERRADLSAAEAAYLRASALAPRQPEPYMLLAALYERQGRTLDSARAACRAFVVGPRDGKPPLALGKALVALGEPEQAAAIYRDWLRAEPGNPTAAHLLAACSRQDTPPRCADAYIEQTFDAYAADFDEKLAGLSYRAPELLRQALAAIGEPAGDLDVLDAGCGTGLCAPVLRPYARTLHGVDLSRAMIARAEARGLYDGLEKAELGHYLEHETRRYDLIAVLDTLIYFGALDAVFASMARVLRPGGLLILTVEAAADDGPDTVLTPTGRYAHRPGYLVDALGRAGFDTPTLRHEALRLELGAPVAGLVVSARRR